MKEVKIKMVVDTTDANTAVNQLDRSIDKLGDTTKDVTTESKSAADGFKEIGSNGGAIAVLDSLTGGLATRVRDAVEASKLFNINLRAMRGALIATGIGALVVALGTIVAYWDDIVDYITQANKKLQTQINLKIALAAELTTELGFNEQIQKSLELQGKSVEQVKKDKVKILTNLQKELIAQNALLATQYAKTLAKAQELTFWERINALAQEDGDFTGIIDEEELATLKAIGDQINANQKLIIDYANTKTEITTEDDDTVVPTKDDDTTTTKDGEDGKDDKEVLTEEQKQQRIQEIKDYYFLKGLEREISEIERKADADIAELVALGAHKSLIEAIEQESADKIAAIVKKASDAKKADNKDVEDDKVNATEIGLKSIQSLNQAASQLSSVLAQNDGEETEEQAKKNFEIQKKFKLAQGAITVTEGIMNAFSQTTDPTPTQTLRQINAGIAATIGLANLANIASTTYDGGGSTEKTSVAKAPTFNLVEGSEGNQIQNSIDGQFDNAQPLRAFVVAQDVTSQQSLDRQIESNSGI